MLKAHESTSISLAFAMSMKNSPLRPFVLPGLVALALGLFVIHVFTWREVSDFLWYAIPVLLSVYVPGRSWPLVFAAGSSVLMVAGYWLSPPGMVDPHVALLDRAMGMGALWLLAGVLYGRKLTETRIGELNRLLRAIREINALITREREPQKLLAAACDILVQTRGYSLAWIGLVEAGTKRVVPAARAGERVEYMDGLNVTWDDAPTGQGPVGTAIRTHRFWVSHDVATDPRFALWRERAEECGFASVAAVPMIQGERGLGAVAVYAKQKRAFREEELSLLNELSADLALALQSIEHSQACKNAEARLDLLRAALESSANAIAITDLRGVIAWVNPAFTRLTGYSLDELQQMKISVLKSGVHDGGFYGNLWQTILAGKTWRAEMINRRKDGSLYSEENTITPVRNAVGEITHFIAVKQDITERKRMEEQLRTTHENLRQLLAHTPAVIYNLKLEGSRVTPVFMSENIERTLGVSLRDCMSYKWWLESLHPEDRERVVAVVSEGFKEGRYSTEYRLRHTDGTYRWVEDHCQVVFDASGQPTQAVGVWTDITDKKRSQEENSRLGAIVACANDGIIGISLNGLVVTWNRAAERIYGYSAAEMLGKSISLLVPHERLGELQEVQRRIERGEPVSALETVRLRKDRRPISVSLTTSPLYDASGKLVGASAIVRDITEHKSLEAQLRQFQKMEAIGQLAGGVAHDFNNMLAVMRGNADLVLMDGAELSAQNRGCLKQVVDAAARAANLTRQLLTFSRKQALQPQPLNLNDVIANLTKMLSRLIREDIRLQCNYGTTQAFVRADVGMLEQVLMNLVVNARDAMPHGGQLQIATEKVRLEAAGVRANPEARVGEFVSLTVSDTGTGIAAEHLPRIFEPFFTTKGVGQGTGLGLATVHGIVKQHEGWIEVSTRIGEGSSFKIFLPAIEAPRDAQAESTEAPLRGGSESILVVEDDLAVRSLTRRVLQSFGYHVHEAGSGREALEVWETHQAQFDLLLTDMVMPEEMTGRQLAETLLRCKPSLKVIFMSGYSGADAGKDTTFIRRSGSFFLHKPCSTRQLIETVRQCFDQKQLELVEK